MPTLAQCQAYAAQYSIPVSKFFIDHDGTYSHAAMYSSMYPYPDSGGSIYLPWNGILGGATHEYVYADGPGPGADPMVFLDTYLP